MPALSLSEPTCSTSAIFPLDGAPASIQRITQVLNCYHWAAGVYGVGWLVQLP